jgi:histidinol-phosphate aminotransferase
MSLHVDPVTRRNLLKWGVVGLALRRSDPLQAYAQPAPELAMQESAQSVAPRIETELIKIDGNENPYGPSERAVQAIQSAIPRSNRYVLTADKLQHAIANHHQVGLGMIQLGYGSSEILKMAADAFLPPGKSVVVASPTYEGMARYADVRGAGIVRIPLDSQHRHDLKKMRAAVNGDIGLIYICNPNNPTATIVGGDELREFSDQIPPNIPIVVDEAYHHYVDDPSYTSAISLVMQNKSVIVTRTFSKIYGMAGLRLGYSVAREDLTRKMASYKVWLNANTLTLAAGLACYEDQQFIAKNKKQNKETREYVEAELRKLGYETIPSQANFFMIDLKHEMQPVQAALRARNVYVGRPFSPLTNFLRVTVGTRSEMERFVEAFKQVVA